MPLVVGVDSSTSACKVQVRDADTGALVSSGSAPHPATAPPRSEQDPSAWWRALCSLLEEHAADAAALSVAAQQHGMVVLDDDHRVLRPAKLWNDTESAPQAERLVDELGAEAWATLMRERAGRVVHDHQARVAPRARARRVRPHPPCAPPPRLADVAAHRRARHRPRRRVGYGLLVARDRRVLDARARAGRARPGRRTGGARANDPCRELARHRHRTGHGRQHGGRARPRSRRRRRRDLHRHLGNGLRRVRARRVADPTGVVAGFADATGRFLPLACTLNATKVTDTVARLLGVSLAELDQHALTCEAGRGGVVMVPYLDGERTPNRPTATGSLSGCAPTPNRNRSPAPRSREWSATCSTRSTGSRASVSPRWRAGSCSWVVGLASMAYQRVVADLAQRPVLVPALDEHVALGACVQAAALLGART